MKFGDIWLVFDGADDNGFRADQLLIRLHAVHGDIYAPTYSLRIWTK